jgi:hypothetical protein
MSTHIITDSSFVQKLQRFGLIALALGALGIIGTALTDTQRFFAVYLYGFIFFAGISVVAMFFSTLQFLVQAGWSALVRRVPEFFAGFVPFIVIGIIPILADVWFGHKLYHWTHHGVYDPKSPEFNAVLASKQGYLNPTFFTIRVVLYCVIWFLMYRFIVGNSFKQDASTTDYSPTRKNLKRAAPFVLLFALSFTFAGFDLVMSLDPHWFSTMFGVYFFAGTFVSTLSLIAIFVVNLRQEGKLKGITDEHYHDIGKFMFAFTVFWTYITFSQFFLIWYGNLPEEMLFFITRFQGGWEWVGYTIVFGHFVIPFCVLLTQENKRNPKVLVGIGTWILCMHAVDLAFIIFPNFSETFRYGWQELSGLLFFGGLFFFIVSRQFKDKAIIPVNDAFIKESYELIS